MSTLVHSDSSDRDSLDGTIQLSNDHLFDMPDDELYHLGLGTQQHNFQKLFGDVMYVITGGSTSRMRKIAEFMAKELCLDVPFGCTLDNISKATDRYAMYKVGPILCVSHGIGGSSLTVMLHELFKLLFHAGVPETVQIFRAGTCGGLGLEPGTVVVTKEAVNGLLEPFYEIDILGKREKRQATLDQDLVRQLVDCSLPSDNFKVVSAKTMCTNDFYEGQGRLDGAICHYNKADKLAFLRRLRDNEIRNIEMECVVFAAMCKLVNIKCGIVCVTLLDRLAGDQVTHPEVCHEWDGRPAEILARFIKNDLKRNSCFTNTV